MRIKTSELTGPALDRMVAKCEGLRVRWSAAHEQLLVEGYPYLIWSASTNWATGGPIIEREEIGLLKVQTLDGVPKWAASSPYSFEPYIYGPTLLVAAMRCYVASKLGEVEVPEELK
jgi:hypothetical protein